MIKFFLATLFLLLAVFSIPHPAHAFPEMARYGYVNCTSCHVSPSGAGVLTLYGRQIASDALSMSSGPGESDFIYGAIKSPEWLNFGGDVRSVEIYRDTPQVDAFRFLVMQADLESAATYKQFTLDFTAGFYMFEALEARQFYLNYRPTDELSIRVGKFRTAYGLLDPDHTTPIHRGLGWDEGTESYNAEAAWLGDKFNAYLTADFGPQDSTAIPTQDKEKGVALRVGVPIGDRFQVGASYFHGVTQLFNRDVAGPFGILGFTHHFFLLTELDYQSLSLNGVGSSQGWVTWNRLDYEPIQGLHGYLIYELTRPDFNVSAQQNSAWGIGSQYFPRPHFEFDLLWLFQSVPAFPSNTLSYVTLLLHFYL
jgi:hypothetical protein